MIDGEVEHLPHHGEYAICHDRGMFVPILMTALAAGLALVPIALSAGEPGSEIQAPMAMVIMFGLVSSTALNMVVVPILYDRFGRPAAVKAR